MPAPTASATESGNALVELALTVPLFIVLIAGGAEIANIAWASIQLNNAARAGVAFGSMSRANSADSADIERAAQNEAPKYITALSQVTPTQVCYCVDSGTPGTADPGCTNTNLTSCASPDVIQVAVQVNATATVTPLVHYPGLPASYTMHARATMAVVQ